MAIEWVALGLSVGSLLARIASLSDGPSWDTFADAADSATTLIRATRVENRINPDDQMVKALTSRLQTEHERYLRDYFPSGESDPEVQAVVSNVAEAMMRLASETGSNHARTLLAALEHPEDFLRYVRSHAGDAARRTVSQNAEPAFDYLLAAVSKDLCKLLRTSASAQVTALGELLRLARQTVENHEAVLAALLPPAPKPSPLATLMAASMRAREATRPKYMPAVDRRREFGLGQDGNIATPLVILGEGGAGKSVVAGDLVRWTGEDCLLVPCSRIPANADLGTSDAINIALGDAASDSRDGVPLTEIVSILPGSTLVAIDTIDLLLRFDTADNLLHLITQLKELRPLVLTSREQEWTDLLGRDSFPAHRLGLLSSDQIDEWVEVYLGAQEHVTDETRQSFRNSIQRAVRAGGRVLLGSPIRLAMACALYAADGAVPAGLSVPQLYRDYWDENVDRDRRSRRRTADAEAQQHAAMEVAARIWQSSSGHFVEYVGTSGLPGSAVQDLLSSGVLRSNGALLVGYFHQTFAEFAVARHLAVNGTDLDAQALQNALAANSPAHWGIARYLGWAEMDASQAVRLAKALPDNAEGIRIRLRMLSTHSTPDALTTELLTLGSSSESLLRPAFQALSDADATSTEVVLDMALRLINASSADLSVIAHTIGKVLPSAPPETRTGRLLDVCRALAQHGEHGRTDLARLLQATLSDSNRTAFSISALFPLYQHLGPAAQKVLVVAAADLPDAAVTELLHVALQAQCPSEAIEQLVDLAERIWDNTQSRRRLGWTSWRSMLDIAYPQRWDAVQVRLAGRLCRDKQVRSELLEAVLDPERAGGRRRYTNAASFAAALHPAEVARGILAGELSASRAVAGNICTIVSFLPPGLSPDLAAALWVHLEAMFAWDERRILTAMVGLGAHMPELLDRTLDLVVDDLESPEPGIPRPAIDSCWDALFGASDEPGYLRRRVRLARLVDGNRVEDRRRRIRMAGREALNGEAAWKDLVDIAMDRGLENYAKLAVAEVIASAAGLPASAHPLVELIASPHGSSAMGVANALSARMPTDWMVRDVSIITKRLAEAVERRQDTQVSGSLLTLLSQIARQQESAELVDDGIVDAVLDIFRRGLDEASSARSHKSAWLDQWLNTMSQIGVIRFSPAEVGAKLGLLLQEVDAGSIGRNASRRLGSSLIGITGNAVGSWRPVVDGWRSQPVANQLAVADALVQGKIPGGREIALQRAREEGCPARLADRIHTLLGT